eukprot:m.230616 g.230616  ORF g.230616 m.230616 type:complete len:62 (+) comp33584_c0_seq2:423-608(+)
MLVLRPFLNVCYFECLCYIDFSSVVFGFWAVFLFDFVSDFHEYTRFLVQFAFKYFVFYLKI